MGLKFFDLFAGVGGFRLGMERAGHECVGACEWDKYARQTYNKNFGHYPEYNDAKDLHPQSLPQFDVLCAGFPCQAFSLAGKRMGFEDTRGTVFFEIARIAKEKRPRYLFLENVKGLLYHDKGRTFRTILSTFDELGYDAEWQILNSKYFVPQSRERIFIIGHLRGKHTRQVFPLGEVSKLCSTKEEPTSARTLTGGAHSGGHHSQMTLIMLSNTKGNIKQRLQKRDTTWTLDCTGSYFAVKDDAKFRRFTPVECERLQGFPDNWTEGVSVTQRYKQMGNAVTVPVVEYIARCLE